MNNFKECFECHKKPGSPTLCPQCVWVRINLPDFMNKETWQEQFDKGCNTSNISDPPSDKEWIKAFIADLLASQNQEFLAVLWEIVKYAEYNIYDFGEMGKFINIRHLRLKLKEAKGKYEGKGFIPASKTTF